MIGLQKTDASARTARRVAEVVEAKQMLRDQAKRHNRPLFSFERRSR